MKFLVFFVLALVCVQADVNDKDATILSQFFDIAPDGSQFSHGYETSNQIKSEVSGVVNNINSDTPDLKTQGNIAYVAPGGEVISWSFVAGTEGYQAVGDYIPTPPPTPDYILRLLSYLESNTKYRSDKK